MSKLTQDQTFKVGETVVHLSFGVGVIVAIEEREFTPGKKDRFYILEIEDNGAPKKAFIPLETAHTKLRRLVDLKTAQRILAYVAFGKPDPEIDHQTWNRRYREYMERIHTGDAMAIAEVYVSLRALAAEKDLSFGERKLAEQARTLLEKELSSVGLELPKE